MPNFFLIEGQLGAGKTLLATILSQYFRVRSGNEVKIFANYDMYQSTPFDSPSRWLDVATARGSVIVWDEAQTQFDRRTWTRNTFMTTIFNYSRKLRCVHMFINPLGKNLDQRILDVIEIFMHVKKIPGRGMAIDIYDYQDKRFGDWGRYVKRLFIPQHKIRGIWGLELYDTDAILYPFPAPKTEREQTALLEKIIDAQREAAEAEKRGITAEGDLVGWVNPRDYNETKQRIRDSEIDGEGPEGARLSIPQYSAFGNLR